ncbi:MAG: thiamine-phosphate kinase [bacterium]|nr:thiamine-phosphate kinase [bacterium]
MNEFEFIKNIKKKYSLDLVGDDCAVLPKDASTDLLISTDMLVEDIDFRLDWTTPELLGRKALAVSLSDVAAMGGSPVWALLSIGIPEALWSGRFLDRFYDGWHELANRHGVKLVGGDISRTPNKLVIDSTVGGSVPTGAAVLRSGARAGDSIYVTGPLGGAAAGLRLLNEGLRFDQSASDPRMNLLAKQLTPTARVELGPRLGDSKAVTSMIDLSDGISSDLAHICRASNVGAVISVNDIPFEGEVMSIAGSVDAMLDFALNGGEDFELLFTGPQEKLSLLNFDDIFRIGEITETVGVVELERDSKREVLPPGGYRHF